MLSWIDDDDAAAADARRRWARTATRRACWRPAGGSTPQRLDEAYRRGIFPWFSPGQPVLWWSPDPRMVLPVARVQACRTACARRCAASCAHPAARCASTAPSTASSTACAAHPARRPGRHLDRAADGGGLHRLAPAGPRAQRRDLGRRRAGRRAVRRGHRPHVLRRIDVRRAAPTRRRSRWPRWWPSAAHHGITLIDCQQNTGHLASLGAREMSRNSFEQHLSRVSGEPEIADWTYDPAHVAAARGAARHPPGRDRRVTHPKELPLSLVAVLCHGALPVQLPAGPAGALAGGHAQPPDPRRRLFGPGGQRLPAQRHVHLPALLRRLPRLRAAARAGGRASSPRAASAAPGRRTAT